MDEKFIKEIKTPGTKTQMRNSLRKSKLQEQNIKNVGNEKVNESIKTVENITSRLNQAKEYRGQEPAQKKYYIHITVIKKMSKTSKNPCIKRPEIKTKGKRKKSI